MKHKLRRRLVLLSAATALPAAVSAQKNAVDFPWDSVARLRYAACTEL